MAKVKVTTLWELGIGATGEMFNGTFVETEQSRSSVVLVYEDLENRRIELTGKKLQFSDGDLISGKITEISYTNADGDAIIKISGVNINVKAFDGLPEAFGEWLTNPLGILRARRPSFAGAVGGGPSALVQGVEAPTQGPREGVVHNAPDLFDHEIPEEHVDQEATTNRTST